MRWEAGHAVRLSAGARLFRLSSYPSARAVGAARVQPPGGQGMVEDFGEKT